MAEKVICPTSLDIHERLVRNTHGHAVGSAVVEIDLEAVVLAGPIPLHRVRPGDALEGKGESREADVGGVEKSDRCHESPRFCCSS